MNKQRRNHSLRSIAIAVGGGIGLAIGTSGGLVLSIVLDDIPLWMFACPVVGLIIGLGIGWKISNG